ncbi:hypothetical protein [Spirulina major]|uniref:hypothetical protein n=1 Tax=Spirulina major TaxID=270636 RepID=UPI0009353314|nr:hypothetical protein [Spirulina major]
MVGFLKKLTGKGEDFYLEIKDDDAQPSAPLTPKAKEPEPAAPAAVVSTPEPAAVPAPAPAAAPAPVAVTPPPAPAPKPEPQPDVTFAPDYLLTLKTFSKRRPGPSMAKFMGLAQQMKR